MTNSQEQCFWANVAERNSWKIPEKSTPTVAVGRVVYKFNTFRSCIEQLLVIFQNGQHKYTVVPKDEYQCGDMACFLSTGTIVPKIPQFEFLKDRNYRVKQAKFKGYVSEGIVFKPYDTLSCYNTCPHAPKCCFFRENEDVLGYLRIKKINSKLPKTKRPKKNTVQQLLKTRKDIDTYLGELHPDVRKAYWVDVLVKKYERHIEALKHYWVKEVGR